MSSRLLRVKGFGRTSSIPDKLARRSQNKVEIHTMMEVKLDVITPDIRGHGDYRGSVELADEVTCRDTIQVRHNNIH